MVAKTKNIGCWRTQVSDTAGSTVQNNATQNGNRRDVHRRSGFAYTEILMATLFLLAFMTTLVRIGYAIKLGRDSKHLAAIRTEATSLLVDTIQKCRSATLPYSDEVSRTVDGEVVRFHRECSIIAGKLMKVSVRAEIPSGMGDAYAEAVATLK